MIVKMRNPTRADLAAELRRVLDQTPNLSHLARELGVSRDSLYKWRRGDAVPDLDTLSKIANLTGTTIRIEFGPEAPPELDSIEELQRQVREMREWMERLHDGFGHPPSHGHQAL